MDKYSISFVSTCPACGYMQKGSLKNMGKSHADDYENRKTMTDRCKSCLRILEMALSNVVVMVRD